MNETTAQEKTNTSTVAQITARIQASIYEARKDEAVLKRVLETRRLKRSLKAKTDLKTK